MSLSRYYDPQRNSGRSLEDFIGSDEITLYCSDCELEWNWAKKYFVKVQRCPQEYKHSLLIYRYCPEAVQLSTDPEKLRTSFGNQEDTHDWYCETCNTYFRKPIETVVKDLVSGVNPCKICAPIYRIKTGKLFLKNHPDFKHQIVSLPDEDFYEATSIKFTWKFDCGHQEDLKPTIFLLDPRCCTLCREVHKKEQELKAQEELSTKAASRSFNLEKNIGTCDRCGEQFTRARRILENSLCADSLIYCDSCKRVRNGKSLRDELETWSEVRLSKKNTFKAENLTPGSGERAIWECTSGHEWESYVYATRNSCPKCSYSNRSKAEIEIAEYVESLGFKIKCNDRTIIAPYELDIVIPSLRLAIEYNGLYWHSGDQPGELFNLKKRMCDAAGYQLLVIWEDDFNRDKTLIFDLITHKLGKSDKARVYARKTQVRTIDYSQAKTFLNSNHIQGVSRSQKFYGLTFDEKIVAALGVSYPSPTVMNIDRYATSIVVVGGFSKLLEYAVKQSKDITEVTTFSDNMISDGDLYRKTGFTPVKTLSSDYSYFWGGKKTHKFNFRLKRFKSDPALKYEEGKTERELANLNGIERIWDLGKIKWSKKVR